MLWAKSSSVYEASASIVGGTRFRKVRGSNRRMPLPVVRLWMVNPGMPKVQDDRGPHNATVQLQTVFLKARAHPALPLHLKQVEL